MWIPVDKFQFLMERVEVLNVNRPFLIGLNIMTKYKMCVDKVQDRLCLLQLRFEIAIKTKNGNIY